MKIRHLHTTDFKTSAWSGGTTTELYLYPEQGSYADRDFKFRISSATVELEESDFTPLSGVERYITPLDGAFVLAHPGTAPVELHALADPYRFSGEIPTHCVGRATDFNLMLKGCRGKMELRQNTAPIARGFNSYFPVDDTVFSVENQAFSLKSGELLVIFAEKEGEIAFEKGRVLTCWAEI